MSTLIDKIAPAARNARILSLCVLVTTIGTGLFTTGGTLFYVRAANLEVAEVVVGLSVAGVVGLVLGIPAGHAADRLGPRGVTIAMLAARAAGAFLFVLVDSWALFIVVATFGAIAERSAQAAMGALVARAGGTDRVKVRAYLRSVTNVGVGLGSLAAAPFIAVGTRNAYLLMMVTVGLSLSMAALVLFLLPPERPLAVPAGSSRWPALCDGPYLLVALLHGLMTMHFEVLSFAVPLWLVQKTSAPSWIMSVLVVTNTIIIVLFQVKASRGTETPRLAAAVGRRAGLTLAIGCLVVAGSAGVSSSLAVLLLVGAVVVWSVGELWQSASSFALSFDLAKEHAQGQYQGVFALGRGMSRAFAPAVLALLCLQLGQLGWVLLGAVFVGLGVALKPAVRYAERRLGVASAAQPGVGAVPAVG